MRLFSEEVTPTFTNSNLNIIYVKDFNEVFFDVYELEINGKKYVTEKVSEYKGSPVVDIPIVYNGKEYTAPFVVQRGEFSLFFNENNSTFVKLADTDTEDNLIDVISEADGNDEVEEIILEKRESILQDIQQAKLSAKEFLNKLKQKQLKEVNEQHEQKLEQFNAELNKVREGLVEEFVKIVTNVQSDVSSQNEQTRSKLKQFIIAKVDKLTESIEDKLNNKADEIESFLQDRVDKISNDIVTGTLATSFKSSQKLLEQQINERFGIVNSKLTEMLDSYNETNEQNIKDVLSLADDKFLALEKATIELNDNLTKTSNKALSRIGNVKTQLEESISRNVSDIQKNISIAEERISAFYDERISNITENINTLTADNKQECLRLISESKESLLKVISEIKVDVPNIIIEQKDGKGKEIDIKKIKGDLEKSITSRFTNEISSLKRMMELMSGGGSVAQQFADGGTMNGNLTVVGTISASQYLGIPVPRQDFLPLSGGVVTGNVSITGTLSATMIEALSANITVIDIKQYELSGFNVQGDATVQGSISASGSVFGNNIVYNGGNTTAAPLSVGTNTNQDLIFETNSLSRMTINSGGNVGIGTSTPNERLTVSGNISATGNIIASSTGSSTASPRIVGVSNIQSGNAARFQFGDALNSIQNQFAGRMQLQGYWGIVIAGSRQTLTPLSFEGGAGSDASLTVVGTTVSAPVQVTRGAVGQSASLHEWRDSNNSTLVNITSGGFVGVGVSAPNERLQVTNGNIGTYGSGNGFVMYNLGQGNYSGNFEMARFMPISNEFLFQTLQGGTGVGRNLRFAVGNAGLTLVNSSGNIGVGTSTPNERLTVSGNISATGTITNNNDIEVTDLTRGVILKSPNGTRFRVTVGDDGALTTTAI